MNYSTNELCLNGGSSTHLNASNGEAGSAAASSVSNASLANRSVLKELHSNESISVLATKAALINSKLVTSSNTQLNSSKISTTFAGSVSSTVENNSSVHKLDIDPPQLESGLTLSDHTQQQQKPPQHDQFNNCGVNKPFNKFVGLTEFDETKIPELPGDLNPNIEEQYNLTFEECFIPTLNAQHSTTVPDEFKVDKTHLLLPTETDVTSSDNEVYTDCDDEKDPLASTFAESSSLDVTDLESFQSAGNKSFSSTLNNTMENIADITMEAVGHSVNNIKQKEVEKQQQSEQLQTNIKRLDEDEPMDIDMNATMEVIQNTSNNIQHVEKVLQHAENILQNLEDKKALESVNTEYEKILMKNQADLCNENAVAAAPLVSGANKIDHLEKVQSRYELSLDKSIELLVNKSKTPSAECIIEHVNKNMAQEDVLNKLKNESDNNVNKTNGAFNSRTTSNSSTMSLVDSKLEAQVNSAAVALDNSLESSKISVPTSSSFPSRTTQSPGFPRSPKALSEKLRNSPFLEKSDYLINNETQAIEDKLPNNSNESYPNSMTTNLNGNILEAALPVKEYNGRRTFALDISAVDSAGEQKEINALCKADEKRRTFSVKADEPASTVPMQFPSIDKAENNHEKPRRTFNIPVEEFNPKLTEHTNFNSSSQPMDIDEHEAENSSKQLPSNATEISQHALIQNSQSSSLLPNVQQKSQSPLTVIEQKSLPLSHLSTEQVSESPLAMVEVNSQSSSQKSKCPSLPTEEQITQSPTTQLTSTSQPQPTMELRSQSPPLESLCSLLPRTTPTSTTTETQLSLSITHEPLKIKEEQLSPESFESTISSSFVSQPLSTLIHKRPPIRDARIRASDMLSAKEQSNTKVKDEKDVFVERDTPSPVSATTTSLTNCSEFSEFDQTSSTCSSMNNNEEQQGKAQPIENEFSGNNIILNPSDFDYLLTKGNNNIPVDRSSLLLKFDPLLGVPVPVNQGQQQLQLQLPTSTNSPYLCPTIEEDEHNDSNPSFVIDSKSEASAKLFKQGSQEVKQQLQLEQQVQQNKRQLVQGAKKKNATMSVDVIKDMSLDNDCNKAFENSNSTQSDDKQINYKMDELEKKIKNEVLKTEDIEKKLKDAEQREEALIKRITEKDKTIAKMAGVIEAYEKAIAELIADKEQITQHYEKQLAEAKADRDSNYHHLTSLETTFSDLHVKYGKSKEMTCQLKESEEALKAEKRKNIENLHLQEQRYDKMKNHAMQQLEIANKKLESLTREHSIEITKLKALLKKEEIARSSINEQLAHKTKENAELVKICDELISGQGIS